MARIPTICEAGTGWLEGRERNDNSQFGEDGLIEAALERYGIANRCCFEVGAADGVFYSNTKRLRDDGWRALLVEANDAYFDNLRAVHATERVTCVHATLTDQMDQLLADAGMPHDMDLGVIDIDGGDYHAWEAMETYRPRLMLVEYSPYSGPDNPPGSGAYGQAGINPLRELGESKRYVLLATTYCNALFVSKEAMDGGTTEHRGGRHED